MTDKEKLHQILLSLWKNDDSIGKTYYNQALQDVQTAIDLQEEPVSEDLEEAAKNHAVERFRITRNRELAEKCKWSYITGAEWLFERVKEALLSEVLPCFMHGGEADEVVAKLDEVLNFQKKQNYE